MKIKIFARAVSTSKLENEVNAFILQPDIKVLELQYSSSQDGYSVMIVYEEENAIKPSQYRVVT
jgi:hypothetical protein